MPRYYFHLNNGDGWTHDNEGQELGGADHAMKVACEETRAMFAADALGGKPIKLASFISVEDERGNEIGRVRYDEAVKLE